MKNNLLKNYIFESRRNFLQNFLHLGAIKTANYVRRENPRQQKKRK